MMTRNEATGRVMHTNCLDCLAFTWSVHNASGVGFRL